MKNIIKNLISSTLTLLLIAALCSFIFNIAGLAKPFKIQFNYTQWVAIIAIINLVFPKKQPTLKDDK